MFRGGRRCRCLARRRHDLDAGNPSLDSHRERAEKIRILRTGEHATLGADLARVRSEFFVGRDAEKACFDALLNPAARAGG